MKDSFDRRDSSYVERKSYSSKIGGGRRENHGRTNYNVSYLRFQARQGRVVTHPKEYPILDPQV
jgi:hypothetical protein